MGQNKPRAQWEGQRSLRRGEGEDRARQGWGGSGWALGTPWGQGRVLRGRCALQSRRWLLVRV